MVVEKEWVSLLETTNFAKGSLNGLPLEQQKEKFVGITYVDCNPLQTWMLGCVVKLRTSEDEVRSWLVNWELKSWQSGTVVWERLYHTPKVIIRGGDKGEFSGKNRVCSLPNFIFYWKYDPDATGPCEINVISKSQLNKSHTEQIEFCGFRECVRLDLSKSMRNKQFNTGFHTQKSNTEPARTITTEILIFNIQEPLITITAWLVQPEDQCGNGVSGCRRFILRLEDYCGSCESPRMTYVINGFLLSEDFNSILPVKNEMDPKFNSKGNTLKVRLSDYYCGPIKHVDISPLEDYTSENTIRGDSNAPVMNPGDSTHQLYISRDKIKSTGSIEQ